ncbi:MAG TPA: tetratricopeptide repeat protein [Pyrinomonadaceae bacterium]|nr:tetratricopeptide repeat protein [Pyrinomonadaceae bacterium]
MTKKLFLGFLILICLISMNLVVSAQLPNKKQVDQARKLNQDGEKLYKQKKYRLAIEKFDQSIAIMAKNPMGKFGKGLCHYELKENDAALSALTGSLDDGFPAPLQIYQIRWSLFYEKKDFDNALHDLQAALQARPNDNLLLIAAGDIYRAKNMDREAISAYEKAAPTAPNGADLFYIIAVSYANLGEYVPQGVAALKAVQKQTRFLGESWYLIGDAFQRQRKFDDAAAAYERAISAKPDFVNSFINLSQIYQLLNRLPEAVAIAKKGTELHPNDGTLFTNLAWYYSLTDQNEEAVNAGKKAIQLLPKEAMGYTNLCRAYNDLKQYNSAIDACNSALKISPNDGETNFYMARALDFLKKPDAATPYYNKAVKGLIEYTKSLPDNADGYYLLGNAYYAVSKRPEAINAYKQCLLLSPNFTKAIYNLGYMYVLGGDKTSARTQYNELLKLDKDLADKLLQAINGK